MLLLRRRLLRSSKDSLFSGVKGGRQKFYGGVGPAEAIRGKRGA